MTWWNSSWTKKKAITLTGGASGAQSAYQVKLTVTYDSDMKSDFSDLRFTNAAENALLDSWMESHTASTSAVIWVETNTPANNVDADIYMYYGNSGAASDWDIGATFLFGDDFSDGDYTSDPTWTVQSGTWSAANYYLEKTANDGTWQHITVPFARDTGVWELKMKGVGTSLQNMQFCFMSKETNFQNAYTIYYPNGSIRLYKILGGVWEQLGIYSHTTDGNWHDVKVERDSSGNMKLYLDGTERISVTNTQVSDSAYMAFRTARLESFDTVRVRKYAANPPTYAFGNEESSSLFVPTIIIM